MNSLTVKDSCGNWTLKGVRWVDLLPGKVITKEVHNALYGALCKLRDYEDTGYSPDSIEQLENAYDDCRAELMKYKHDGE